MKITEKIKNRTVFFDGGTGTLLQGAGLAQGELPEEWNISHSETIIKFHKEYIDAGADIIKTNTFGAYSIKFGDRLDEIINSALDCAHEAVKGSDTCIALDLGPTGKLLKPYGDLDFEDAVEIFAQTVRIGAKRADLILIETMSDTYELKAAVLAAKENCNLPVFATVAFDESYKLMTGASPSAVVALLEGLGVDAIGMNCGFGPKQVLKILPEFLSYSSTPVIINPNAGLPVVKDGKTLYSVSPEEFAQDMVQIAKMGARIVGGCCGTTPAHIKATKEALKNITPTEITEKNRTIISSYTHSVEFGNSPILIGERINPTGKPKLKAALRDNDMEYILHEGIAQQEKGVHVLDVNVGLPEINEPEILCSAVCALQEICDLPLQIDTSDYNAMERALRRYNGKPLINSVNGKQESMDRILPLAAKYGGVVIALTLDESGIPETAEQRVEIAEKIYKQAEKYGISKKNIIVDPLALTISSDERAAQTTLESVRKISENGGCTSLGVSNVSFGLPMREHINSAFFTLALGAGLSAAIMNPYSDAMMMVYRSFRALNGYDESCADYIASVTEKNEQNNNNGVFTLTDAIIKGLCEESARLAEEMAKTTEPLEIINGKIIPALDEVGKGFEQNRIFLPQLLKSAEASKAAFEKVKAAMPKSGEKNQKGEKIIIATVKGDIHDIGKNIVKVLLENYGYDVIDLGRDVPPEVVVKATLEHGAKLVGLSALMTTTVVSMEETIKQLHEMKVPCKIVVGGAVMTQEYADRIKADKYAKDAMETVRYANEIFAEK